MRNLKKSKYYSTINLNQGFYQVKIKPEDTWKTSFIVPWGQFEFVVMPFGLSNALRTFQRIVTSIFGEYEFVKIFIDDILIYSKTEEEHFHHVKFVLEKLLSLNISINFNKSLFNKNEIKYLGHFLTDEGYKADKTLLNKILINFKWKTKRDLRKFIDVINWLRPFIPNISVKLAEITDLLKGKRKQERIMIEENNLKNLKEELIKIVNKNIIIEYPILIKDMNCIQTQVIVVLRVRYAKT